jgi:hypothetical protein
MHLAGSSLLAWPRNCANAKGATLIGMGDRMRATQEALPLDDTRQHGWAVYLLVC